MRIINLMENTPGNKGCKYEHGLSFYIETDSHKIIMDTGATDGFFQNANALGIDLSLVDTLILSHGHYDHSGGIMSFYEINKQALIYVQKGAGEDYYHKNEVMEKYIGIDKDILGLPTVRVIDGDMRLDSNLNIFSKVTGRRLWPSGNRELMVKKDGEFVQDEFLHEQYLVIEGENKNILVSGCAHNGVLNILDRYKELYGSYPAAVISGFHMQKKNGYSDEDIELFRKVAQELKSLDTVFYTGHCTGELPFQVMKEIMGDSLVYVHSGDEIKQND